MYIFAGILKEKGFFVKFGGNLTSRWYLHPLLREGEC